MRIQKYNFPDTGEKMELNFQDFSSSLSILKFEIFPVIWNPWLDKARETPDFGDDEYPNMICVESGHVSSPVLLLPGTAYEASQILQVIVNPKR